MQTLYTDINSAHTVLSQKEEEGRGDQGRVNIHKKKGSVFLFFGDLFILPLSKGKRIKNSNTL